MDCTHEKYKKPPYACFNVAIKDPRIVWTGKVVKTCENCGADISRALRVETILVDDYIKGLNK
jgi:hypothetical protein